MTYKEFLNEYVISEEEYNDIKNSLPKKFTNDYISDYVDDPHDINYVCFGFVGEYPIEEMNVHNKEIVLDSYQIDSIKELEDLRETFKGWSICNYIEILEELKEYEKEEEEERKREIYLDTISSKATLEQLEKFAKEL